ncbi:hypothetical protein OAN24_05040 [Pseudodesulfovibrio sp.]|nr:hypothetical protein [Pseudodesulfovibrio sp.]
MRKILLALSFLLLLSFNAFAASDIIATYKYSDGSMMTLCTRDAQHVRMDTSPTSYMLLKGNKVYGVNKGDDGSWQVMDMDQMQNLGGMSSMFGGGATSTTEYEVRYEKTGKSEKVAGYSGAVYKAVTYENGKVVSRDDIVLCSHSNIKKLSDGWAAIAARMGQSMGQQMAASIEQSAKEAKKMGYGGMLRYGNQMRLSNLQVKNLNSSYYELPAGAQVVDIQAPPQQSSNEDMGLDDDAKDIGHHTKEATKDEIKSGISDVIGNIFN